jgi:hypothetical protein
VRGEKDKYDDGLDLAVSIRDAAHYASITGYLDVRVLESAPVPLGENSDGQPEWSMTVDFKEDFNPV